MSVELKWPIVFNDYFARRFDDPAEIQRWHSELLRVINGVTDDEICAAIRNRSYGDHVRQTIYPGIADLRGWITNARKKSEGYQDERQDLKPMARIIRDSNDQQEIWEAVCSATDVDDCRRLEEFAKKTHPTWTRPAASVKAQDDALNLAAGLSGKMRTVSGKRQR